MSPVRTLIVTLIVLCSIGGIGHTQSIGGWERIYAHDDKGNATFGSLKALREAALDGADVKVKFWHGVWQIVEGDRVVVDDKSGHVGLVAILSIYNVRPPDEKHTFHYEWRIENKAVFATDGWEHVRVIGSDPIFDTEDKKHRHNPIALDWFVRR